MIGTLIHMELQLAKSMGYHIDELFVQHHFPLNSTNLFYDNINTFFEIKRQAQADDNVSIKKIVKLMIDSPTRKWPWGFNPSKQCSTHVITETD